MRTVDGGGTNRYLVFCYFQTPPNVLLFVRANNNGTARTRAKRYCERTFNDIVTYSKTIGIDTSLLHAGDIEQLANFN